MTIHDSSFNTYTYIHVCILPIWDTSVVLYKCLVRIVQIRTARSGRVFCSSGGRGRRDEGGVASRLAPGGVGSVRSVRFLSVRIGFYRIGSRVFRGRVRTVYCVLGVPNHPYVGGHGWMDGMRWDDDGMGWNGTRMERDALEPGARARSG